MQQRHFHFSIHSRTLLLVTHASSVTSNLATLIGLSQLTIGRQSPIISLRTRPKQKHRKRPEQKKQHDSPSSIIIRHQDTTRDFFANNSRSISHNGPCLDPTGCRSDRRHSRYHRPICGVRAMAVPPYTPIAFVGRQEYSE